MRTMITLEQHAFPFPLLRMYIHGMPHMRMHRPYLQKHRENFTHVVQRSLNLSFVGNDGHGYAWMIDYPVDINVTYINPSTEDLDHLMTALYMLVDGPSGSLAGPSLLYDDRLIKGYTCRIYHPEAKTKRETERW